MRGARLRAAPGPAARPRRPRAVPGGRPDLLDAPRADALAWLAAQSPAVPAARSDGRLRGARRVASPTATTACSSGASLEVRRGEIVALTGPNGVGKTTLALIAAGLLQPDTGSARHEPAAFLAQDPGRHLVTERVLDEVALGSDVERARAALAKVGLAEQAARHPRDLSVGERERLALAAVLVTEPELLVLDEPTRGVDPERKAELARTAALRGAPPRHARRHARPSVGGRGRRPRGQPLGSSRRACVACCFSPAACSWRRSRPATARSRRCSGRRRSSRRVSRGSSRGPTRRVSWRWSRHWAAAAAAGRVLFSALPGVQPVTVVAVVAGVALGLRAGVATGAIAAFASNLFLGQGIWTPQQMLGWAACGAAGALLAPLLRHRLAARRRLLRARLALQREHGRLALVRVLPAYLGLVRRRARTGRSGSTSRTRSATSCSHSRSAPSCGGCSTVTAVACGR